MKTGVVFDIQPFSTHDGPGIRTVVFLKGCPLRCLWCHNPEGVEGRPQLSFLASRCTQCGRCANVCPNGVHTLKDGEHTINWDACKRCGACVAACPNGALDMVGKSMTVESVLDRLRVDRPFFDASGGGLTLSGGEPLRQASFAVALLTAAHIEGIHTLVETAGHVPWAALEAAVPVTNEFYYDIKETDPERHREYVGVDNSRILSNLRRLHDAGARITVRLPLIPGLNDRPEHLDAVARLVETLPNLAGVEKIKYHPLGRSKLARFGLADRPW